MDRYEYEWIRQVGTDNDYGISFGDLFYLRYCGLNIVFYVCKTTSTQVCLFELAKKKIKYQGRTVEVLCRGLPGTQSPLIVTEDNCYSKSHFWVDVKDEEHIWIPINKDMPICERARKKGYIPKVGEFEAYKMTEEKKNGVLNYYMEL